MVYGLDVYPTQGHYIGYECLDGDLERVMLLDPTPDEGGKPTVIGSGRALSSDHVPTRVKWLDRKRLPMGDLSGGPLLNVSARAKALVESLEPNRHQFMPVEFLDIQGGHLEDRWFMVVCNRLDTVDRENVRGFLLWRGRKWYPISDYLRSMPDEIPIGYDVDQPSELVFNKTQIGDAHLWVDRHLTGGILVSDEFDRAYVAGALTGRREARGWMETV